MTSGNEDLRSRILDATIIVFDRRGIKLTMADIATEMSISKKTIYKEFESKDELFDAMVDHVFDSIKEREQEIADDPDTDTVEKLRKLLGAMPEKYQGINYQELAPLKEKHPKVYKKIVKRLETGWEATIALLEKGKSEGVIREDADVALIKVMLEATIEKLISGDVLRKRKIKYVDALNQIVDIIVDGIAVR
ncbi:MAG: TetR/AcrR family transcriptional regulator [Clostridiales bacterium]|nr:TetR/AcrR family transcriptional regulator [Clostridiales bacterium]